MDSNCILWNIMNKLQLCLQLWFSSLAMIGPPTVIVIHSNKSIIIKLQAPRSPYKRKRGSQIPMTNYYDLLYQVFIINNLLDEVSAYSKMNIYHWKARKVWAHYSCFTVQVVFWDCEGVNNWVSIWKQSRPIFQESYLNWAVIPPFILSHQLSISYTKA